MDTLLYAMKLIIVTRDVMLTVTTLQWSPSWAGKDFHGEGLAYTGFKTHGLRRWDRVLKGAHPFPRKLRMFDIKWRMLKDFKCYV